ncbi:MAG TPA: chorismate synthase [Clostridiales bacterium]|nr:chorismate synthase [Clostridiales bacterium]HRT81748.1 chorismate synthase [Oscillospiraceae bacterium]
MSSSFGKNIKISVFGQSHSRAIGVVIDGLPAGEKIDMEKVIKFMARRRPGATDYVTQRREEDRPQVLSGLVEGVTCGAPLAALIENTDTRSQDYDNLRYVPRPSHSDFPAFVKHEGFNDIRGGGHFSGRLTAPLCFAGAVCKQILERRGVTVGAHIDSIGTVKDSPFDPVNVTAEDLNAVGEKDLAVNDSQAGLEMVEEIKAAARERDSIGGRVECAAVGLPVGIGNPMFDGMENRLAAAIFGIPAVRGIEFGLGLEASTLRGSEHNDPFYYDGDKVKSRTNNHGGILGGMTTGMPLVFRVAFKPTSSIGKEQDSVDLVNKEDAKLNIVGRHDPCIVTRAVVVVEAVTAAVLLDSLL